MLPTDSVVGPSSYTFRGISDLLMSIDLYEVRLRKEHRGVDLISDALPFGRLWYCGPNAISNQSDTRRAADSGGARPFVNKRLVSAEIECATACHDQIFDS